jgi:haloacetate dehalogenase
MSDRSFPGFTAARARVNDVEIPYAMAGRGAPVLLLHGFPQTKAIWHKIAPTLAERFTVVAADLRGYGDASKPVGSANHSSYSKREMARDQVELMRSLGFTRFGLVGHDRGGRVGHRLAADHPDAVAKLMVLDISPTLAMYEQTNQAFATAYWHWFFLIQPSPLPEDMISADVESFLKRFMGNRSAGLAPFTEDAWAEYVRAAKDPACIHAMCEDYRAAASIDLEHDRADREAGHKVSCPLRVLWGKQGVVERCFRPLDDWARVARDVTGRALECGHYIPEEAPEALIQEIEEFFS